MAALTHRHDSSPHLHRSGALRWPGSLRTALSARLRLTAFAVLLASPLAAETTYPRFTLGELQEDFDQFTAVVNTTHPKLYTNRAELATALVSQRAALRDQMDELEFFRVLSPLVRRLNCGHTNLGLSSATESRLGERQLLPLAVRIVQGRLYVTRALTGSEIPIGAEILSINSRSSSDIIQALYDNIPADGSNLTLKQYLASQGTGFRSLYSLYVDATATFAVTYLPPTGRKPLVATLEGRVEAETTELQSPFPTLTDGIGWSEFTDDYALLAVATFNFYDTAGHTKFFAFVDRFFDEVKARQSPCVILDLRGNGGGDPYCGSYLLSHLLTTAVPYFSADTPFYPDLKTAISPARNAFTGRLYTLINGGCFSTTGHFVSLLKYHQLGSFIGEETGGSYACTASTQTIVLTHTRLQFHSSVYAFSTAVVGLTPGRGIMPDHPVVPSVQDGLSGRDVVKDFALSLLRDGPVVPAIVVGPRGTAVAENGTLVLDATASGAALTYQWQRDGTPLPGATARQLVLTGCTATDAGRYTVTVSNPNGATTSPAAAVMIAPASDAPQFVNVSVRTITGPAAEALSIGFVTAGGTAGSTKDFLLRGLGPALEPFNVPDRVLDPAIELHAQATGAVIASNDNWSGDAAVVHTGAALGAFPLTDAASKDAAVIARLAAGSYSVRVIGANDTRGSVLLEVYDAAEPGSADERPRVINLSARAPADRTNPLIAGFVITGRAAKTVLIRGVGPGLAPFLGAAAMENPRLEIYRHHDGISTLIERNEDWAGDAQVAMLARQAGAFALPDFTSKDAALLVTLEPGAYSIAVTSDGPAGIALAEIYAIE